MVDGIITYLASLQSGFIRTLAGELRAGGIGTAGLAFALGAVHALTPGHGKAALAAYFLGRESGLARGIRIALSAALLHVLSGFAAFLVLRFILAKAPSITGRGAPAFTVFGYGLIFVAGALMLLQSLKTMPDDHHGAHALTAGIGLLPCPLTISVLGFAWLQGSAAMVGLVLVALAFGIATTIGIVALAAITARNMLGTILIDRLPQLERAGRVLQGVAGTAVVLIACAALVRELT
jgi:ABC-type nickel/cobalt efflux system permease component RcnA